MPDYGFCHIVVTMLGSYLIRIGEIEKSIEMLDLLIIRCQRATPNGTLCLSQGKNLCLRVQCMGG